MAKASPSSKTQDEVCPTQVSEHEPSSSGNPVHIRDLKPDPENARVHGSANIEMMVDSDLERLKTTSGAGRGRV